MGDRANIIMEMPTGYGEGEIPNGQIFFYTHWDGSELPAILQSALARRQRWDDESYLARIIFSEMIKNSVGDETGYGISLRESDNSYAFLRVNTEKKTVTVDFDPVRKYTDVPNKTYSFEEYVGLADISWEVLEGEPVEQG